MTLLPPDEFIPHYKRYIDLVEGPALEVLQRQFLDFPEFIRNIPDSRASYAYAPGKWTVKEVIGHVLDTERIMSYRALRIARNDQTPLPGFDENSYAVRGGFNARSLQDLEREFRVVRQSSLILFESLDDQALRRKGTASGRPVSVRALMYIIAGHTFHHCSILQERYLIPE